MTKQIIIAAALSLLCLQLKAQNITIAPMPSNTKVVYIDSVCNEAMDIIAANYQLVGVLRLKEDSLINTLIEKNKEKQKIESGKNNMPITKYVERIVAVNCQIQYLTGEVNAIRWVIIQL